MYNEGEREPTFNCLHEHDPECKPVYSILHGSEAAIFLDREARSATLDADPAHGALREPLLHIGNSILAG